jgi:hypothetical protein
LVHTQAATAEDEANGIATHVSVRRYLKVYGDMPLPIDGHAILRHLGGNANGIKTDSNDKGMVSTSSHLRDLQAESVSILESNIEWQEYEWR